MGILGKLGSVQEGSANMVITILGGAGMLALAAVYGVIAFYDWCAAQSPVLFWSILANIGLAAALVSSVYGGAKAAIIAYQAGVSKAEDTIRGFERGTEGTSRAITASVAGAVRGRNEGSEIVNITPGLLPEPVMEHHGG